MPLYPVINKNTQEKQELNMSLKDYEQWRKDNPDWDKDWHAGVAGKTYGQPKMDDGTSRRRVELGSGMEKTLTALTIRSALSNISLLPTCNLFVIDEGFGTLDSENINHMNMLLGYLKGKFDNVLIISHIESMQDITNNVININKNERGYSSIKIL